MGTCPKCKAEIEHLNLYEEAEVYFHFKVDPDGCPDFEREDIIFGDGQQSFVCPECHAELFTDEKDATLFFM
jgi:hypothetical protein